MQKFNKENIHYLNTYQQGLLEKFNETYKIYETLSSQNAKEYYELILYVNKHFANLKLIFKTFIRHLVGKVYTSLSSIKQYIDATIKASDGDFTLLLEIIDKNSYIMDMFEDYMKENHIYLREKLLDMIIQEVEEQGLNTQTLDIVKSFNNCNGEYIQVNENTDELTEYKDESSVLKSFYEYAYDQIDNVFFDSLEFTML